MEETTQNIVNTFFKHLSERDLNSLVDLFAEEIDWFIPGDEKKAPWLGRRNSKQDVHEFYELLWKNTEAISVNIDNVFIDKNKAVISGEFSTRMLQTDKIVSSLFFIQITTQNSVIIKYRLLEDSLAVSNSLTI